MADTTTNVASNVDKIELFYNADRNAKGELITGDLIEQDYILEVRLTESMFTTLPRLVVKILDGGTWYHTRLLQAGIKLLFRITPKHGDNVVVEPYVDSLFTIQGIKYTIDQASKKYIYELNCFYAAETYLTKFPQWPQSLTENPAQIAGLSTSEKAKFAIEAKKNPISMYARTSKQVLEQVLGDTSLKFNCKLDEDPKDKMPWLNTGMTYVEFTKYIISHAWISRDDIPFFYVDKNGMAWYTTLNTMCKKPAEHKFMFETNYNNMRTKAQENQPDAEKLNVPPYLTYRDMSMYNEAFKQINHGYCLQASVFNPYMDEIMENEIQKEQDQDDTTLYEYRKAELTNRSLRLGKVSNKTTASGGAIQTNIFHGMHFRDTHEFYDIAPTHHTNIMNSFFSRFVVMTVDTYRQEIENNQNASFYPKLGEKVYIDASDVQYTNTILGGNFLISAMTHAWIPNKSYTIFVQCVSDGMNSTGMLGDETKEKK